MEKVWFLRDDMMVERYPHDNRFVRGTIGKDFVFFAKVCNRKTRRGVNKGRISLLLLCKRILRNGRFYSYPLANYERCWKFQHADEKSKQALRTILRHLEAYPKY